MRLPWPTLLTVVTIHCRLSNPVKLDFKKQGKIFGKLPLITQTFSKIEIHIENVVFVVVLVVVVVVVVAVVVVVVV